MIVAAVEEVDAAVNDKDLARDLGDADVVEVAGDDVEDIVEALEEEEEEDEDEEAAVAAAAALRRRLDMF